jgi:DNA-binding beta-propeller fold protein YncE
VPNRIRILSLALPLSLSLLALVLVASSRGAPAAPSGLGSARVGSAPTGTGPSELAVDPATHTIYVANGNNDNGPNAGGDTVSVIDTRRCDARDVSRCKGPWPTITVGNLPTGIAVDEQTDTVYVASSGDNSVSVFNGAICNATNTSGCRQMPASVPVGLHPAGVFDDPANHTVYVGNLGAPANGGAAGNSTTISMLDSATCNATDLAACPTTPPPTVTLDGSPSGGISVDQDTASVYVTTIGKGLQNGWTVFNATTCNATVQSGCATLGQLAGDSAGPNDGEVDQANDTLYTANYDNTISVFDLSRCNAADLAGCASDKPGTVTPSPNPGFEHDLYAAVDPALHSVYVSYQLDDALAVIDTNVCNGTHLAACAQLRPHSVHTGADPQGLILDPTTQTLYTANEVDGDISVIDASSCSAEHTAGCRHPAPSVLIPGAGAVAPDNAVHTAYVTSGNDAVAMIDTRRCNAGRTAGCSKTPREVTVGQYPSSVATNPKTGTVYVARFGANTPKGKISVIDASNCNAMRAAGCQHLKTLALSAGQPHQVAVNPVTDTIYVALATAHGHDVVDVFNGATCNATRAAGCHQKPRELKVGTSGGRLGNSSLYLAVNPKTNTLYVTNVIQTTGAGHTVYVLNGATCDATDHAGCGQTPATITVGRDPSASAIDPGTNTIYVTNHAGGDYPATVSVIDGATCDATHHGGCHHRPPTTSVGFGAIDLAVDPSRHRIYTANLHDTSVSVIDGATCNARHHGGCQKAPATDAVGDYPEAIAADPGAGTAYVVNLDNTVSVLPLGR